MPKTTSLLPLPGSKRAKKYDLLRKVPLGNLCEPFMGGASTSIMTGKPSILGDVNPWHRGLVKAVKGPKDFIEQYNSTVIRFVLGLDPNIFWKYDKRKKAQTVFREENPRVSQELDRVWKEMCYELYHGNPRETLGLYSFMQRACFKNTLRLNPTQTALNVSWHVLKIKQALAFDPQGWAKDLEGWNPGMVLGSYQEAIDLADPKDCHLLLDPPYYCPEGSKMTPCYIFGHKDPYGEDCLTLATRSLELGLSKGFPVVHLCNYYSPELEDKVRELAAKYRYPFMTYPMGAFPGNNARLTHGERVDSREKPVEVIWEFIAVR